MKRELNFENYSYLMRTLRAPSGVTSVAGANMYAAKLQASPAPTAETDSSHMQG